MPKIKQLKFFKQPNYFKATKEEFNTLLTDKLLKKIVQVVFVFIALNFLSLAFLWIRLPPKLPLFYNRPRGQEQLVVKNMFSILPLTNLIFVLLNLRIASFLFRKEYLLSQILVWSSLVITLMASISLISIFIIIL
ncbi:hypothetical protein ACFLZ1_01030 [Patescibacteria group bacterium]